MATSWIDAVRQRGTLSIYADASLGRGVWAAAFREALQEFNALSRRHGLGVTLTRSDDPPREDSGADVSAQTADGAFSRRYSGTDMSGSLDGHLMHGRTQLVSRDGRVEKAFIYLPSQPRINTPRGARAVGAPVMKLIAVHEMVHACGLANVDHSTDDLFQASPQVDPGSTGAADRVRIEVGGRTTWMPPLVLSSSTVGRITRLWSG